MKAARSLMAVCVIMATVSAGCFGPWNAPPPGERYYMEFEGGSGYREILSYANTTGSFPLRGVIDPDWKMLYVGFNDGALHVWNFSNESAITHGTWPISNHTCVGGGLVVLPDHSVVAGCGAHASGFSANGSLLWTVVFSSEITGMTYASLTGNLVAGVSSPPALEARSPEDGKLVWRVDLGDSLWHLSSNGDGTLVGGNLHSTAGAVVFFDLRNGTNRTMSVGGAFVPFNPWRSWVILNGGWDDDHDTPHDTLRAYDWPVGGRQLTSLVLENASSSLPLSFTQDDLYGTTDGSSVAYYSVQVAFSFSNGQFGPATDTRNLILSYDVSGALVRGMAIPGQEIHLGLLDNGSMYAVSGLRAVLGGSQLWLSYGAPDCTPPLLVRHNITG